MTIETMICVPPLEIDRLLRAVTVVRRQMASSSPVGHDAFVELVRAATKLLKVRTTSSGADLYKALAESVKLQAHYANLLNMHDGGHRMSFPTPEAWIARLRETGTIA